MKNLQENQQEKSNFAYISCLYEKNIDNTCSSFHCPAYSWHIYLLLRYLTSYFHIYFDDIFDWWFLFQRVFLSLFATRHIHTIYKYLFDITLSYIWFMQQYFINNVLIKLETLCQKKKEEHIRVYHILLLQECYW